MGHKVKRFSIWSFTEKVYKPLVSVMFHIFTWEMCRKNVGSNTILPPLFTSHVALDKPLIPCTSDLPFLTVLQGRLETITVKFLAYDRCSTNGS